jgi:hypothetical protein
VVAGAGNELWDALDELQAMQGDVEHSTPGDATYDRDRNLRDAALAAAVALLPVVWWEQTADEAHRHAADVNGAATALDCRAEQGRAGAGYELADALDAQEALVTP